MPLSRLRKISLLLAATLACLIVCGAISDVRGQSSSNATGNENQRGIKLYEQGETDGAIKALRAAVKQNKDDANALFYLGKALIRKGDLKGARKAFEKAVKLRPDDAPSHAGFAYLLLLTDRNPDAAREAEKALALDAFNAEAHYVSGVIQFRRSDPAAALEKAESALRLNPNYALAWLLKSQAILGLRAKQISESPGRSSSSPPLSEEERKKRRLEHALRFREAADSLDKFLQLSPKAADAERWREELESLRLYASYADGSGSLFFSADDVDTKARIIGKPSPGYTEAARHAGLSGTVILMLTFVSDRTVKHIVPLQSLGYGLTEKAIEAARDIEFVPASKNGQPVSQMVIIEYNFNVY